MRVHGSGRNADPTHSACAPAHGPQPGPGPQCMAVDREEALWAMGMLRVLRALRLSSSGECLSARRRFVRSSVTALGRGIGVRSVGSSEQPAECDRRTLLGDWRLSYPLGWIAAFIAHCVFTIDLVGPGGPELYIVRRKCLTLQLRMTARR